jgi:hypothetical protein
VCDEGNPVDKITGEVNEGYQDTYGTDDIYIGPDATTMGDSPSPLDMPWGIIGPIDAYIEDENDDIDTFAEAVLAYLEDNDFNELSHNTLIQLAMIFLGDGDFYFDKDGTGVFVSVNPINENGVFAEVIFTIDGVFFRLVSDTYLVDDGSIRREVFKSIFVEKANTYVLDPPWPAYDITSSRQEMYRSRWYPWWDHFNWPPWWGDGDRPQPVFWWGDRP